MSKVRTDPFSSFPFLPFLPKSAEKKLQDLNAKVACRDYVAAADFVQVCIRSSEKEQAFVWLAKAVQERNRLAWELKINPLVDVLQSALRKNHRVSFGFAACRIAK